MLNSGPRANEPLDSVEQWVPGLWPVQSSGSRVFDRNGTVAPKTRQACMILRESFNNSGRPQRNFI